MMAADERYLSWRAAVDQQLREIYCITIADAGFDEEYMIRHWQSREAPADFVGWFGDKYDLDRLPLSKPHETRER
jgi:hypothetical protein